MHRHDALTSHQLVMMRFIAGRVHFQCNTDPPDLMTWQGCKLTRSMAESQASPSLACCLPDGKTAKSSPTRLRLRDPAWHQQVPRWSQEPAWEVALAAQETYTKALGSLLALLQEVLTLPSLWTTTQCDDQLARCLLWLFHQGAPRDEATKSSVCSAVVSPTSPRQVGAASSLVPPDLLCQADREKSNTSIGKLYMDVLKGLISLVARLGAVMVPPRGRHRGSRVQLPVSLLELQKRGGWQCFASVRRYEKQARLNLTLSKVSAGMLREVAHLKVQL